MKTPSASAIFLRPPRIEDAESSYVWRDDPAIRDGAMGYSFPTSIDAEKNWLLSFGGGTPPTSVLFSLIASQTQELVGYTSLRNVDWVSRHGEFGLIIGPPNARGQGYGRSATLKMLERAFDVFNLDRVWLRVVSTNEKAIRLYQSIGFVREGVLRKHAFQNGGHEDVLILGIFRSEFTTAADRPPRGE